MPRIVDAEERRALIVAALWRVIARDGLDHASVRSVATEAGLSVGSLRHYFASQSELLTFALGAVGERLERRLVGAGTEGTPRERVRAKLAQMLPLDAERRLECEVWLAFTAKALTDASLRTTQRQAGKRLDAAFTYLVDLLAEDGLLTQGADRTTEAVRLSALVDGLIIRGLSTTHSRPSLLRAVDAHLDDLTR